MEAKFSPKVKEVIAYSREEALGLVMILLEQNIYCWV